MIDQTIDDRQPIEYDGKVLFPYPGDTSVYAAVTGEVVQVRDDGEVQRLTLRWNAHRQSQRVCIPCGEKIKTRVLSRLIYESCRGPMPSHSMAVPIDGNVQNVSLDNLKIVRKRCENLGTRNPIAKLSSREVMEVRSLARSKSANAIGKEYGLKQCSVQNIINNKSYQDCPAQSGPSPATQEIKDALLSILTEIGIHADMAFEFSRTVDADGYVKINMHEINRKLGRSMHTARHYMRYARKAGILNKVGYQRYRARCVRSHPDSLKNLLAYWEEIKAEKVISDYQRDFILGRVRRSLAAISTEKIRDVLVSKVSKDGTFNASPLSIDIVTKHHRNMLIKTLIADGIIERMNSKTYRFLDLPPRQPVGIDPLSTAKHLESSRKLSESTVADYTRSIELLVRGCSLQAVYQGSGVQAGIAEQLQRVLQMGGLVKTLLDKCSDDDKARYLAKTLMIPLPAAQALMIHARNDNEPAFRKTI